MFEATPPISSRIFISYRREDSAGHVLALLPALRRRFGVERIAKDTDSIPPGQDFLEFIKHELESCSVLLAIIGRDWLTVPDPLLRRRRLDNPDDFLRVEVGTALSREHIRVIPVLVERAAMPSAGDLPPDLAPLASRNPIELSDVRWESDVQRLIVAIERVSAGSRAPIGAPGGVQFRPQLELVELQPRLARQIDRHLATALEAMTSQDFETARLACEKVLLLDPEQRSALELLDRAQKAIDEIRLAAWLEQAQALLSRGAVAEASDLIDQALAVDNTSKAALALRKEMLRRERERERIKAVHAAIDQARASLDEGDFAAAIRSATDTLARDPDASEARDIRSKAEAALQERRTQRERAKLEPAETNEIHTDSVKCTVFAPPLVRRGEAILVQVFAHLPLDTERVDRIATTFDSEAVPRGTQLLDRAVARGARLVFQLTIPGAVVDDPIRTLTWDGAPESVQFGVTIPKRASGSSFIGTVLVSQNSVPFGDVKFLVRIVRAEEPLGAGDGTEAKQRWKRYNRAFISYASADRPEVLKRVQMLRRLSIELFQDLLTLEPGERWARELYKNIDESDVFFLFWSTAAKQSEWVMKEVRYAIQCKGGDEFADPEIVPVIIEGPPPVPPPPELQDLHFNDQIMYFIRASES